MTDVKLNDSQLAVAQNYFWINAHTNPPANGAKVRVLNQDGVDAGSTVWSDASINSFDAWLPYAKIPSDVKLIQSSRYPVKKDEDVKP